MAEKIKVVNKIGDLMFEVILTDKYIHLLTMEKKIRKHTVSVKKVQIGTGNSGKNLEYESVYQGFEVSWKDLKQLADDSDDI